ncbi:NADPH--cytochrome P450 reductase [Tolypocladium paradoxum]|uniref:NADPH--cytochrome P450 reductase n=1 Tax=Tolypocladium paradoxum TaxID=94208 RepID=A0A2S4KXQ1_9HYPO|nr:NADPH--cytochrome P450 reductase [Tolypocladium paradoxum]
MAQRDTVDVIILALILLGTAIYFIRGKYWTKTQASRDNATASIDDTKAIPTRDLPRQLQEEGKDCVILYGSQTGTAEDYASRLAKEGKTRFALKTMVAGLDEYDFENIGDFPNDKVIMFVMATYGEGEPTDNAVEFYELITADNPASHECNGPPLDNLNYVAFGLGNSTYEHYNATMRNVDKYLTCRGAHRIGDLGEGDDGAGTTEDDFLAWKDRMWAELSKKFGLKEHVVVYEPALAVVSSDGLTIGCSEVFLGEPNEMHLQGKVRGPFDANNPYVAPIVNSEELFSANDRNCVHIDIDIGGSNLTYQTGDHIAIWPSNPDNEVDRFLAVMGLTEKRHDVINITAIEPTAKVAFPSPTTYDALARYYLEIGAPASRQFVSTLATFSPTNEIKAEMTKLGKDKDYFYEKSGRYLYNIARLLETIGKGEIWDNAPFSAFIESMNKLQPRFYSISSSSLVHPQQVSITVVVESRLIPGRSDPFRGIATNYLFALKQTQKHDSRPEPIDPTYKLAGPRNNYDGNRIPVYIRHSKFKLPLDHEQPVIMIGPGTGVAPFRGFVQERARLAQCGTNVGRMLLFFGCRKSSEDFVYKSEWEEYGSVLSGKFELITAFSRESNKKVYVQHRLQERAIEVNELLSRKAHVYVCGDAANMAREVRAALAQIIAEGRGVALQTGEETVKQMKATNQYQEDVWS